MKVSPRNNKEGTDTSGMTNLLETEDPLLKTGKAYKFVKPFRGPYKIVHLVGDGAEIQLVAKPKSKLPSTNLDTVQKK